MFYRRNAEIFLSLPKIAKILAFAVKYKASFIFCPFIRIFVPNTFFFMSRLLTIWNHIRRHKYLITILAFLVVIVFLDENSLIQRAKHKREISTLNSEINRYRKQYEEDTRKLKELMNNPEALEKIAREKYLMKKPNEDIFIFEE